MANLRNFYCKSVLSITLAFAFLLLSSFSEAKDSSNVKVSVSTVFKDKKIKDVAVLVEAPYYYDVVNLEDGLYITLLSYGYTVSSRSDVDALLKEIGFQGSGLTDGAAAKIGKILNVPTVFIAKGEGVDGKARRLSLRVLDVESVEIIWLSTYTEKGESAQQAWVDIAKETAQSFPSMKVKQQKKSVVNSTFAVADMGGDNIKKIEKLALILLPDDKLKPQIVEDVFMQNLMDYNYRIVSRSDTEKVLKEINFQNSGLTGDNAAKLGKMLSVPVVLIARQSAYECLDFKDKDGLSLKNVLIRFSIRFVDVERGKVLWVSNKRMDTLFTSTEYNFNQAFERTAKEAISTFPKRTL